MVPRTRRGKATSVDPFTGEDIEIYPSLERAKLWDVWTEDELMLQLASHLYGRARLEWSILGADVKKSYTEAVKALRLRTLAAQELLGGWSIPLTLHMAERVCQLRLVTHCHMDSSNMHSNMS